MHLGVACNTSVPIVMERPSKRRKADEEAEEEGLDACAALSFHLLQSGGDGEAASFHPEMCHQVFGDEERIHGWSGVPDFEVKIWLSQTNYEPMLEARDIPPPPPGNQSHAPVPPCHPTCQRQTPKTYAAAQVLPATRRRPEGATDVAEALGNWFPADSLWRDREAFQTAAAQPLDLEQLGSPFYETDALSSASHRSNGGGDATGLAVYRHRLSEANSYVIVSHAAHFVIAAVCTRA